MGESQDRECAIAAYALSASFFDSFTFLYVTSLCPVRAATKRADTKRKSLSLSSSVRRGTVVIETRAAMRDRRTCKELRGVISSRRTC